MRDGRRGPGINGRRMDERAEEDVVMEEVEGIKLKEKQRKREIEKEKIEKEKNWKRCPAGLDQNFNLPYPTYL